MKDVRRLVAEAKARLTKDNSVVARSWVVKSVIKDHPEAVKDDFAAVCVHETLGRVWLSLVQAEKVSPEQAKQLDLPGFAHIQRRYSVERFGERCDVPLEAMTELELVAKENELRQMGRACLEHADELSQVRELRFGRA